MKKRASDSQISNVVPKKLRLDLSWLPLQDQAGEETQKVPLQNIKVPTGWQPLHFSFRTQGKMYLVNPNEKEKVSVTAGTIATGFGKGKWLQEKAKEVELDVQTDVGFVVTDMGQWIILDNCYTTVEYALHSKVEKRIQYHKMQDVPGQPGSYKEHKVFFRPDKAQLTGKMTQVNSALLSEVSSWNSSLTKQCWVMQHSINGLGPVRPVIVFPHDFEVPASKCMELK
ncbi:unnamed protein product [Symbiodinium sp. KB8]|nr:unnamed protein product [Symbiodinium sp. KB8]